jgi:site-specific DNA-methyltransferase (adenine-specific)
MTLKEIIAELPKPYYQDDAVAIYCADCRDILPLIPDKSIDLVLTSPPYDDLRFYGGQGFQFSGVPNFLYKPMAGGACCVWVVGDQTIDGSETGNSFRQALAFMDCGFNLHETMIYAKNAVPINARRYEQNFEYMFVFSKGSPKTFNPIMRDKLWEEHRKQKAAKRNKNGTFTIMNVTQRKDCVIGNVWYYNVGGGHITDFKLAYQHPAIFPEALASDHIISWSNRDDLILDPFLGSGTTAYCAKKLGRKCIGVEIEERYCEIAAKRCSQMVMKLEV